MPRYTVAVHVQLTAETAQAAEAIIVDFLEEEKDLGWTYAVSSVVDLDDPRKPVVYDQEEM